MSVRMESPPKVTRSVRRSVGAAAAIADGLLERREPRLERRLSPRERRTELISAGLFVLTAAVLPFVLPTTDFDDSLSALLLVLCYALLRRVRFPLGPGLLRPRSSCSCRWSSSPPRRGCPRWWESA